MKTTQATRQYHKGRCIGVVQPQVNESESTDLYQFTFSGVRRGTDRLLARKTALVVAPTMDEARNVLAREYSSLRVYLIENITQGRDIIHTNGRI